jgi:hypothetical protein
VAEAHALDAADGAVEEIVLRHRLQRRVGNASDGRGKACLAALTRARSTSRSVTMPTSPEIVRMNTLLIFLSISRRMASRKAVSGAAKTGGVLMTSRTRLR